MADRRCKFTLKADATTALLLNDTMGRNPSISGNGPVVAGQTVNFSYTEQQMRQLMHQAQVASGANSQLTHVRALLNQEDGVVASDNPQHFALAIAANFGNKSSGFADSLHEISTPANGDPDSGSYTALPGSITDATTGKLIYEGPGVKAVPVLTDQSATHPTEVKPTPVSTNQSAVDPSEAKPTAVSANKSVTDHVDSLLAAYKANDNTAIRSNTQALANAPAGQELRSNAAATVNQQEQQAAQRQATQQPVTEPQGSTQAAGHGSLTIA